MLYSDKVFHVKATFRTIPIIHMRPHEEHSNMCCLLQVGGFDGVIRLCSADAYNPANNSWTEIASMFSPRSNFGIELLEDLLYVPGGFNGFRTTFKAEYYDRKTNEWYGIHNMNIHRSALDCCVLLGLPNVRDYATSRDTFYREEARRALSDSSL